MNVIIVGGGRVGSTAARLALGAGHAVTVIEQQKAPVDALSCVRPTPQIVSGDGCSPHILEQAGIARADAVIAATDDDEDNLVVCLLAKREYGVARTVGRVNDERNAWMFGPRFGVDMRVENAMTVASLLVDGSNTAP